MYCSSCANIPNNLQWRPLKIQKKVLCKLLSIERVRFVRSRISHSQQGFRIVSFLLLSVCLSVCMYVCLFCLTLTLDVHFLAAADTSSRPTRQTCKQRRKREKEKFAKKKKKKSSEIKIRKLLRVLSVATCVACRS